MNKNVLTLAALYLLGLLTVLVLLALWIPQVSDISYQFSGVPTEQTFLPVNVHSQGKEVPLEIQLTLHIRPFQIQEILVWADDCFLSFRINDREVDVSHCPVETSLDTPLKINIGPYVNLGPNTVSVRIQDTRPNEIGFDLVPSKHDLLFVFFSISFLVLSLWFIFQMTKELIGRDHILLAIMIVGTIIRFSYMTATPPLVRAYDASHHIDYVLYLGDHISLPPASGWEYHQPPLYYAQAATFIRLSRLLHGSTGAGLLLVQYLSFFFSIGTLFAGVWIAAQIFPQQKNVSARRAAAAIIAVLPGLVMLSSRVSNDVLVTLLITVSIACTMRWWQSGGRIAWYAIWILGGLAFLTKLSGIVVPPIAIASMILKPHIDWQTKLRRCVIGCLVFVAMTSWLPAARLSQGSHNVENYLSLGKAGINGGLRVAHTPADFLTFNPLAMVQIPFVNPWSDETRRANYFEYLFRSSLFGEFSNFNVSDLAKPMIILGMLLLGWMIYGIFRACRKGNKVTVPFLVGSSLVLLMALAYAIFYPLAPEQDFRFSAFLGIAGACLIAIGIESSPRYWRITGLTIVTAFFFVSGIFLLLQ